MGERAIDFMSQAPGPAHRPREVEGCPHRRPIDGTHNLADCGLIAAITGIAAGGDLTRVGRDACLTCCDESPPDTTRLNPTVASLVFGLARQVERIGGVSGCDDRRAAAIADRAEGYLAFRGSGPIRSEVYPPARPRRSGSPSRIGLVGWNTPSGLGQVNRDLARHLPIERWLIPTHPNFREVAGPAGCPTHRGIGTDNLREFLEGLDSLLFCELPYLPDLVPMARSMGVRVVCIPMWEYLNEMAPWLRLTDRMICPTRVCLDVVTRLRERLGLAWEVDEFPWPIDIDRFPFHHRTEARRFLFVNGNGGAREFGNGRASWDGRKGVGTIAAAARLAPSVPILVRSQTPDLPPFPPNVEIQVEDLEDPAELYSDGDICILPSRWEGLGLPLLECQARGLPLVTTDAPPMNEHRPLLALPATASEVRLFGLRNVPAHEVAPAVLARALVDLHGSDIGAESLAARRYIEECHSWAEAGSRLLQFL